MNDYINAILRSIIEAITEFLPVSSTGHLFLFSNIFPFQNMGAASAQFEDLFDIFIQSGAILSVIIVYFSFFWEKWKSLQVFIQRKSDDLSGFNFWSSMILGALPIMIMGFIAKSFLDDIKRRPDLLMIMGFAWLFGGIFIIIVEKFLSNTQEITTAEAYPSPKQSLLIGVFQCIALIPGVSRSAATIIAARSLGLSRQVSAEFSFFVAVPVLVAAGLYKLYKHKDILTGDNSMILLLGFSLSFILCMVVIRWFIEYVKKYSFFLFGYYRVVLGVIVLGYFFAR